MILRIWRSALRPGSEPVLLERLRAGMPQLRKPGGPSDFTYGFRQESGTTVFTAVSTWATADVLRAVTGVDVDGPIRVVPMEDIALSHRVDAYEQLPPMAERQDSVDRRLDIVDGRVIGVVTATLVPKRESIAEPVILRGAQAALDAGALAAHVGRRVQEDRTSVAVVVVWPRRSTLTRYLRSRDVPMLDPSITRELSTFRFETYTALAPERLLVPPAGPAVLVIDDAGNVLETTPGVEAVLGVPGELLQGRTLLDLAPDEGGRADLERRFLDQTVSHGTIELLRPDGRRTSVRYRSMADVPAPGLRAAVLTAPEQPEDLRPTAAIVNEALGESFDPAAPADKAGSVA